MNCRLAERQKEGFIAGIASSEALLRAIRDSNRPNQDGRNWEVFDGLYRKLGVLRDDIAVEEMEVLAYQVIETLRLFFTYPAGLEKVHVASAMERLLRLSQRLPEGNEWKVLAASKYDECLLWIQQNRIPNIPIDILGDTAKKRVLEIMETPSEYKLT